MFSLSTRRLSRIPSINGFKSSAQFKWATYTFWYVLDPLFRLHFRYYRRKVHLDRYLEKNNIVANSAIGVLLGCTAYFLVVYGLLPHASASENGMQENAREVLLLMDCDTTKELPAFQLMRVKREIIGKLHAVADLAEIQKQREEVEAMKAVLEKLKNADMHQTA